jgi:hypothetical protein
MADIDDHGRTEPPLAGVEAATLIGFLDYHRDTPAWKTRGLDAAGSSSTVAASSMTLGGVLKHLAYVEEHWFGYRLSGRPPVPTRSRRRHGVRWSRPARRPALGRRAGDQPALDLVHLIEEYARHNGSCRPAPRGGGRRDRGVTDS